MASNPPTTPRDAEPTEWKVGDWGRWNPSDNAFRVEEVLPNGNFRVRWEYGAEQFASRESAKHFTPCDGPQIEKWNDEAATISSLREENERLRAAVEEIADCGCGMPGLGGEPCPTTSPDRDLWCLPCLANAALSTSPKDTEE